MNHNCLLFLGLRLTMLALFFFLFFVVFPITQGVQYPQVRLSRLWIYFSHGACPAVDRHPFFQSSYHLYPSRSHAHMRSFPFHTAFSMVRRTVFSIPFLREHV